MFHKDRVRLEPTEDGFLMVKPRPTAEDLAQFYAKYHDTPHGNYNHSYTDQEIRYFQNLGRMLVSICEPYNSQRKVVDIGCGEGWDLAAFHSQNWNVTGIDATDAGLLRCNSHLANSFVAFDLSNSLNALEEHLADANLVIMRNVLEHVLDPTGFVADLKTVCSTGTVFAFIVPNDNSEFQGYLRDLDQVKPVYWMAYPDHLQYFNYESLERFITSNGLKKLDCLSDFHIETDLLDDYSNYKKNSEAGPASHRKRVRFMNYILERDLKKAIHFLRAQASLGLGRNIIYLCTNSDAET